MDYKIYAPPNALKPYVRYFWSLESHAPTLSMHSFRTMADGCPGLIFQRLGDGTFFQYGKQLPEAFLYGQTTKYAEHNFTGKFSTIGVYFYPNALTSLLGIDAQELTDSCLDIDAEARKRGFFLSKQLCEAATVAEKFEIISSYLLLQSGTFGSGQKDDAMHYALSAIMQSGGTVALKELHEKLQLSERSFERKFKQYIGISPKLFTRICRFQASLSQMRNNKYGKLSDIAFENEYADQSHFIRTFKEFTGFSPHQYQLRSVEIVENFSALKK